MRVGILNDIAGRQLTLKQVQVVYQQYLDQASRPLHCRVFNIIQKIFQQIGERMTGALIAIDRPNTNFHFTARDAKTFLDQRPDISAKQIVDSLRRQLSTSNLPLSCLDKAVLKH